MFAGHAALAFGLVGVLAARFGGEFVDSERRVHVCGRSISAAIALGVVAALAASLPDLDVVQSAAIVLTGSIDGSAIDQLRAASRATHRVTTHSLVLAAPIAAGIGLWSRYRWLATALFVGTVATVAVASGLVAAAVAGVVVIGAAGIGVLAGRWTLRPGPTGMAAAVGLAIHPFTDLLTGTPPAMTAPLGVTLVETRIAPFADPFANLLLATGAELAAIWVGLAVASALTGRSLRSLVHPSAFVGIAYAPVGVVLAAPSVDNAVGFVATLIGVGLLGIGALALVERRRPDPARVVGTALATLSIAVGAASVTLFF